MMKKPFFLFCLALSLLCASGALAAPKPMRAHQPAYGFDFDVYRTPDMPANWWKTYDGFFVTRRLDTNWVYGTPETGATHILVGSVDPRKGLNLGSAPTLTEPERPRGADPSERTLSSLPEKSPETTQEREYLEELHNIVTDLVELETRWYAQPFEDGGVSRQ